jgi:transposase
MWSARLQAPSGSLRQRAAKIAATAEGYAQLCRWLRTWGEPAALLIGMEATGTLWETLHDTLTRAGYTHAMRNEHVEEVVAIW